MADFQDLSEAIRICKDALDLLKSTVGLLPKGEAKQKVQRKIQDADEALRKSDIALAKELGYRLCQCTFPPQIMLSKGRHEVHGFELFKCPSCGKQDPSEHKIKQYDRVKDHNEGW